MSSSTASVRAKSAAISVLVSQLQSGEISKETMFKRLSELKRITGGKGPQVVTSAAAAAAGNGHVLHDAASTPMREVAVGEKSSDRPITSSSSAGDETPPSSEVDARIVLSPLPADGGEGGLTSPDRRKIIQRLLAEKRKLRDAAISNAARFETAESAVANADDEALCMNDLTTNNNNNKNNNNNNAEGGNQENQGDPNSHDEGDDGYGISPNRLPPPPPPPPATHLSSPSSQGHPPLSSMSSDFHSNLREMISSNNMDNKKRSPNQKQVRQVDSSHRQHHHHRSQRQHHHHHHHHHHRHHHSNNDDGDDDNNNRQHHRHHHHHHRRRRRHDQKHGEEMDQKNPPKVTSTKKTTLEGNNHNTPPSYRNQEPSFLSSRRTNDEMKTRTLRAVKEEMMSECTFSPSIKPLPSSYGKPKNAQGDFHDRAAKWAKEKQLNASIRKQNAQENELEDCTFNPATSHTSVYRLGKAERVQTNAGPSTPTEQQQEETIQRLYYEETKRLEERRQQEIDALRSREDEDFRRSCTFKPDLASSTMGVHKDDLLNQVEARYLQQSTEATERRKLILAQPDVASPGPGEYESDREQGHAFHNNTSFNNYDIMSNPGLIGLGGLGMRGGAAHNNSNTKSWSFTPKTNSVKKNMETAKNYLKEDVVERLTKSAQPQAVHALSKAVAEEREDRKRLDKSAMSSSSAGGFKLSTRSKDEASKDFHEFLARQNALQIRRKEHVQSRVVAETPKFVPRVNSNFDANTDRGTFLQRAERYETRREIAKQKRDADADRIPAECTFQPNLLRKSRDLPSRSTREMSLGDAEQKEISNRALRLKVESEELSKYSFKPSIYTNYTTSSGGKQVATAGKLKLLSDPDNFIKRMEEERQKKEAKKEEILKEELKKEQQLCTSEGMAKPFEPKTTECPAYIKRIAHSLQISRKHKAKFETKHAPLPSWK